LDREHPGRNLIQTRTKLLALRFIEHV